MVLYILPVVVEAQRLQVAGVETAVEEQKSRDVKVEAIQQDLKASRQSVTTQVQPADQWIKSKLNELPVGLLILSIMNF